jgi:hypothetical protein
MKSKINAVANNTILGDNGWSTTIGWIYIYRISNSDHLDFRYSTGAGVVDVIFNNLFQSLDNQWIHIVVVCDYSNKTLKAYRNGIQFGATQNLSGTPPFPFTNRVKYIGSYNTDNNYKITDGSLDEVRIYNRGLSAEEIATIYNQTKGEY